MVVVPVVSPLTTPEELTVATAVLLLVHAPPDVAEASVMVFPRHIVVAPVIAAGVAFTDTVSSD